MRSLILSSVLILFSIAAAAQTPAPVVIHTEAESFTAAVPACGSGTCIQSTSDTAAPATTSTICPVATCKIILAAAATFDYAIQVPTTGQYTLTVRLNGTETVHFESPIGANVSGPVANTNALATIVAPDFVSLTAGAATMRMVVDSVGSGYPSANWFELTYNAPVVVPTTVSFACSPSFPAVSIAAFVPAGAKGYTFVLTAGAAPLIITSISAPAGFAMDPAIVYPVTIAAGDSQTFTIRFVPAAAGTFVGNVVFTANVPNGDFLMGVQGVAQ